MRTISNNAKGALFGMAVALIYLVEAFKLDVGDAGMPKAGFAPVCMGFYLLAVCLIMLAREFMAKGADQPDNAAAAPEGAGDGAAGSLKKPGALALALAVYLLVLPYLGFLAATMILFYGIFRIFDYKSQAWSAGAAVVSTAAVYFIFEKWLAVLVFPEGVWF